MDIKKTDWQKLSLTKLTQKYNLTLSETYELAVKQKLYNYESKIERRHWTNEDDLFLEKYKDKLTVKEAANILHKSYNATLIYVKLLGFYEMIGK